MIITNSKIIKTYKAGYVVKEEDWSIGEGFDTTKHKAAYNMNGDYIGNTKTAYRLCVKRGIKPEKSNKEHSVCSIGFCVKENKWYGWSHRAIYGFGIGSEVKIGDCAFNPSNKEEFMQWIKDWYSDDIHKNISLTELESGVKAYYEIHQKATGKILKNETIAEYPNSWGKGEWVAKTLKDAKQMAIDFASGVS